eukprot:6038946-Heterocapsa_arctica.AAC.2
MTGTCPSGARLMFWRNSLGTHVGGERSVHRHERPHLKFHLRDEASTVTGHCNPMASRAISSGEKSPGKPVRCHPT